MITYSTSEITMPLTGPTKNGTFRNGITLTRAGKPANVPPVMHADSAPTT